MEMTLFVIVAILIFMDALCHQLLKPNKLSIIYTKTIKEDNGHENK